MGHLAKSKEHRLLREQLDRYPLGAPGEERIMEILETIFTKEEAHLAARLPMGFTAAKPLSKKLGLPIFELTAKLDAMADKGLVLDLEIGGEIKYCLPPTLVGLFEFSMMRVRDDIDQTKLAELFHLYLVKEPTYFARIKGNETTPFRTLIHEETLPPDYSEVLDYERATKIIERETFVAVGICHCRHVAHHRGKDCTLFELESCLTFGDIGRYLVRHKFARQITHKEAQNIVTRAKQAGMVHIGDNVQNEPTYMCNCCSCCCEVLGAFKNLDFFTNTFSSNFEAVVNADMCNGCNACAIACPVDAIELKESGKTMASGKPMRQALVHKDICIGCGVCVPKCKKNAIAMHPRPQKHIVPENTIARTIMMAVENGTLQNMLVDKHANMGSAAIAAFIGGILKLPPAKQLLAQRTVKSRFVNFLASKA
ncbi:MAG: 4Fe-4S binding protein [Deltaproteobacteria bacterium]|nr:4Fe-4S binding protein [Deltaproteobacteria bacterium]